MGGGVALSIVLFLALASNVLTTTTPDPRVQLTGGNDKYKGYLEVYHDGKWSTFCNNGTYDDEYVDVVCGMLINATNGELNGTVTYSSMYYPGSIVLMPYLRCFGNESDILFCKSDRWYTYNGRSCAVPYINCHTQVELYPARIENYNDLYICDRNFGREEAEVLCRTAGNSSWNVHYRTGQYYGYNDYGYEVHCDGSEDDISECTKSYIYCGYNHGVTVDCEGTEMRLYGGNNPSSGRVQIYDQHQGRWHDVCGEGFGTEEARVVCQTLNDIAISGMISRQYIGHRYNMVTDLDCRGNETDISICGTRLGSGYCSSEYAVAVDCNTVRLMDGSRDTDGRLEIFNEHSGTWQTVCGFHFGIATIEVICRQLGMYISYSELEELHGFQVIKGSGEIMAHELFCYSNEMNIDECYTYVRQKPCNHADDIGITCRRSDFNITTPYYYTAATPSITDSNSNYTDCGGYLNENYGSFHSPNFPSSYPNGVHCVWHIRVQPGYRVLLEFTRFATEGCCDHVHVYDGLTTSDNLTETLSGTNNTYNSSVILSSSYTLTVRFTSDGSIVDSGFNASFTTERFPAITIRLVGGQNGTSGRLEVYRDNMWGTVCFDGFSYNDLQVVCRMLGHDQGYGYGRIYDSPIFGEGTGNVAIDNLNCRGTETHIRQCYNNSGVWFANTCGHEKDVSISCLENDVTTVVPGILVPNDGDVRLVNGNDRYSGRVEVYYKGQWGTVCSRNFGYHDARVVCTALGYYIGENSLSYHNARYYEGQGYGEVVVEDLDCFGNEWGIAQCPSKPWLSNTCSHYYDVGITCRAYTNATTEYPWWITTVKDGQIRLVNGHSAYSGRVEVYHNGRWGTICDDYFDHDDVKVICRQLGYFVGDQYAVSYGNAHFGTGSGPITVDNLNCSGYESNIRQCSSNTWGQHDCGHSEDAGVDCHHYGTSSPPTATRYRTTYPTTRVTEAYTNVTTEYPWWINTVKDGQIRLVNGHSAYSGRVEVYHNGRWGTICDDYFYHDDVKVICRQLGYFLGDQYAVPYRNAHFGTGSGPITIDDLTCIGNESNIRQCSSNTWGQNDCHHREDAGVDCHHYTTTAWPTSTQSWTTYPWWHTSSTYRTTAVPTAGSTRRMTPRTTYPWWLTSPTYSTTASYSLTDAITVGCNEHGWNIRVNMYRLRDIYPNARASDIYLGENTCTGYDYFGILTFTQGLQECLTSEMVRNTALVYTNELVYAEHDPQYQYIIRHYNWTVGVECDVQRNETSSGHIHHDVPSHSGPQVTGTSHYAVNMSFYLDPNFMQPVPGNPLHVPVGTQVYAKVFTTTSDWTIKMRVHSCYTTPGSIASDNLKYYLVKNGCEVDTNTHLISQSSHETRFVFQDFEYTNNHEGIEVMCDAIFCSSHDYSRQCTQTCNPGVRRIANVNVDDVSVEDQMDDVTTDQPTDYVTESPLENTINPSFRGDSEDNAPVP